jgi:DNA-binding protein H-NS
MQISKDGITGRIGENPWKKRQMAKINGLEKMTYAQLAELRGRVDAAMEAAKAAEKGKLRTEMEAMAVKAGLSLSEVVGRRGRRPKATGSKVAPKYRNPQNPEETWAGRGRQPRWVVAALKRGRKLESFLI